jgi:hypothetical protein|tara:strand:+ start:562 stop:1164 length:603 start_codon:yes stop_codon:yes gene_type:complete
MSDENAKAGSWASDEDFDVAADEIMDRAKICENSGIVVSPEELESWNNPQYNKENVNIFRKYERKFGTPRSVFYPGCGIDGSPLRGFPNSELVFLDPDRQSVEAMRNGGIQVLEKGIEEHDEKHDLIILLNPHFSSLLALKNLENGGRIIANNYFGAPAADPLIKHGLPVLTRYGTVDGKAVEFPIDSKFGLIYVFGGGR